MDRFINFKEYLLNRGVILPENTVEYEVKKINSEFSIEELSEYMESLRCFHEKASGFNNYMIQKLPNKSGELFGNYNIMYRRFQREVAQLKCNERINECDEFIFAICDEMEERARNAIAYNSENNYSKTLQRSMDRVEICIGNFDMDSLKGTEPLVVRDISKCFYDMVENDIVRLITRMKRKHMNLVWEDVVDEFLEKEKLGKESEIYIKGCISYPYEFMRTSWRYFQGRRKWSLTRYREKLERAIKQDGKSII